MTGSVSRPVRVSCFLLFFLLMAGCTSSAGKPDPGTDTAFLERRLQHLLREQGALRTFAAEGFFYFKDRKTELNLAVRLLHDRERGACRITFRGNLDDVLWADIVVRDNRVLLHFPLQKTLYRAALPGFDLYPFTKIHVQMEELLRLAALVPHVPPGAAPVQSTYTKDAYILYREGPAMQQKIFMGRARLLVDAVHLFSGNALRAILQYSLYKPVGVVAVPHRLSLDAPAHGTRAVLWLRQITAGVPVPPGALALEPLAGTEIRDL